MSDEVPLQELQEVGRVELRQGPTYLFRDDDATNSGLPIIVGLNEVVAISCVFGFFEYEQQHKLAIGRLRRYPMKHLGYVLW